MPPAARMTDMHTCPMVSGTVPHVGGPILPPCMPTVLIGFLPAARVSDMATCVGPPDVIVKGSPTVLIGGMMAARIGDLTAHGGVIIMGLPTVMIGEMGGGFAAVVNAVNPGGSTINCGHIVDAVIGRLDGTNPNATAPNGMDGSFQQIEQRHNTTLQWNSSFQQAFNAVRAGGDGTRAIVGIQYGGGGAHVVVLANQGGSVAILEAQDWGPGNPRETITTPERANERYNSDGTSNVGYGIIP